MRTPLWGLAILLGLLCGLLSVSSALASGLLPDDLLTLGSTSDTGTQTNESVLDTAGQTVSDASGGLVTVDSHSSSASTPVPDDDATGTLTDTVNQTADTVLGNDATPEPTSTATDNVASTVENTVNQVIGNLLQGSSTSGVTDLGDLGDTVDQGVSQVNTSAGQATGHGQTTFGVPGAVTANTDPQVASHLGDPTSDSPADAQLCGTLALVDTPIGLGCPSAQVTAQEHATVTDNPSATTASLLGTESQAGDQLCLHAGLAATDDAACGETSHTGLVDLGVTNQANGVVDPGADTPLEFHPPLCLDATLLGSGTDPCTGAPTNGLADLGTTSGLAPALPLDPNTTIARNLCLNLSLAGDGSGCATGDTGEAEFSDAGATDNTGNTGGTTDSIDNGDNGTADNGDAGNDNGIGAPGDNGNTGNGDINGGDRGNAGVPVGNTGPIIVPVVYRPGNILTKMSSNSPAAAGAGIPSLLPATGHAQALSATAASTPGSSESSDLLALLGLVLLLSGGGVLTRTRHLTGRC